MLLMEKGEHLGIYHIGTQEEVTIRALAEQTVQYFDRDPQIVAGPAAEGGTLRRCPDTSRIRALGFEARKTIADGLPDVVRWYEANAALRPEKVA